MVPPMDKGKDVIPPFEVVPHTPVHVLLMDEDVVLEEPPSGKQQNYVHYQEEGGPSHLYKGWATFVADHQIKIGYMVTFKLLTPDTLKVDDDNIEVVTKCGTHDDVFVVTV
ncbi:Speckle-type POZ protein [Hordeum vulgare]|nr:Speckle-type POZ protein [Hordeum vulgare]